MNKRAQIGTTITWFFAIIAIFLILIIFFVFSGLIAAQKIIYSEKFSKEIISSTEDVNYFSVRAAMVFLESSYKNETKREYLKSSLNIEGIVEDREIDCYAYCFELPGFLAANCFPPETSFRLKKPLNVSLIDFGESEGYNKIKFEAWNNCEK